jgi:uncharacterized protein YndB with AHSA1/START domain
MLDPAVLDRAASNRDTSPSTWCGGGILIEYSIAVDIPAPPERVWAVLTDIERWPEWAPTVTHIAWLHGGALAVGSRARIKQPRLPTTDWEVSELHEGRGFTWVSRSPGARVTAKHAIAGTGSGTRATLTVQFEGPLGRLVGRLTRGLNQRYLALEAQGLRDRSVRG